MTLLVTLVDTSQRVGATSARLAKVKELAACLKLLDADEVEIAVQYLSGETRQGRFGIGYAVLRTAMENVAANEATLTIRDVDARLEQIAGIRGAGSTSRRAEALRDLFSRATSAEQEFLLRLLMGELRQG